MLSRKILKITFISFLGLVLIILLFLGLRINSYKIFITSLVDGEEQIGLNKIRVFAKSIWWWTYNSREYWSIFRGWKKDYIWDNKEGFQTKIWPWYLGY